MHLGSLESTQAARVALGCASSYSYGSFVLSKLPMPSASITRYTHAKHAQILNFTCVQKDKQTLKTKGTVYKLDKFPDTDQFVVFFQLNVISLYGRLFRGEGGMFIAVPLFLKNILRCSPKFIFTEFSCSQKLLHVFMIPKNIPHCSPQFLSCFIFIFVC